ncbi:MAG: endolytic transglycosylase MltG [Psychroflexus sp.]|nr:endolytic transglycosylase MltG [Psychroflexus sp.]
MKNRSKVLVGIALLGVVIFGVFAYFINQILLSDNTDFEEPVKYVYIKKTDNFSDVMQQLDSLLINPDYFQMVAQKKNYSVKSGKYPIEKGMNNNEIVNALRSRNTPVRVQFSYEKNLESLTQTLAKQVAIDASSIYSSFTDDKFLKKHNLNQQTLPAVFLPNTYEMYWDVRPEKLRDRLYKEYQKFWTTAREEKRKALNFKQLEVSTLASIVRKETSQLEEADKIAGVYINRLNKGIALQADPTVIFALQQQSEEPLDIKRVLTEDLKIDSPYNTYQNAGLPPGPICIPEISYLKAVLNFEKHDYYYFAADPKKPGFHQFAKTLSQHNQNAREYRRWINKQKIYR